jgi:hypothetical protein
MTNLCSIGLTQTPDNTGYCREKHFFQSALIFVALLLLLIGCTSRSGIQTISYYDDYFCRDLTLDDDSLYPVENDDVYRKPTVRTIPQNRSRQQPVAQKPAAAKPAAKKPAFGLCDKNDLINFTCN